MTDRWAFSDLDSLRERFFDGTPQPADAVGWLQAEHRFAEHLATGTRQASPHWNNFDMDGELRDRRNAGTITWMGHPEDRAHIAYNDPAGTLRRIEAERAILAEHGPDDPRFPECARCGTDTVDVDLSSGVVLRHKEPIDWPCRTMRLLAAGWGWSEEAL